MNQPTSPQQTNSDPQQKLPSAKRWIWIVFAVALVSSFIPLALMVFRDRHAHTTSDGYLGPKKCAQCHKEQAASWAETRMAKSFEVLRPDQKVEEKRKAGLDPKVDYTKDKTCLPCHTTGFGLVGGFVSFDKTPDLAGVTCEACHGPGGMYVGTVMSLDDPSFSLDEARSVGLVYPPTARVCRKCHNQDSPFVKADYEFDYEKMKDAGTHKHVQLKYKH